MIDLAIIGGGPAGTATALEGRRRGLTVSVFERERFPRDKVCGEFISAESLPLLNAEIPEALHRASRITRAEFVSPHGRVRGFELPSPARGLSRWALDDALWNAAGRAGADVQEGAVVKRVQKRSQPNTWEIECEGGRIERVQELVVACGRWWNIEGLDSPVREVKSESPGKWLGAKAHFAGVAPRDAVEMYFFPGGYCGLAPVEDGIYNACCLVHRSLVRSVGPATAKDFARWIGAVARHPALDQRLRSAIQTGETVTTAPVRPARRRAASQGALFVGDAAGFLDPFTGDGISMALASGRLAAEVLAEFLTGNPAGEGAASRAYMVRLNESVRRSYAVASLVRALVRAPAALQDAAAALIPLAGARLHAGTRWRASQSSAESAGQT